jgi:hypothetical protein
MMVYLRARLSDEWDGYARVTLTPHIAAVLARRLKEFLRLRDGDKEIWETTYATSLKNMKVVCFDRIPELDRCLVDREFGLSLAEMLDDVGIHAMDEEIPVAQEAMVYLDGARLIVSEEGISWRFFPETLGYPSPIDTTAVPLEILERIAAGTPSS